MPSTVKAPRKAKSTPQLAPKTAAKTPTKTEANLTAKAAVKPAGKTASKTAAKAAAVSTAVKKPAAAPVAAPKETAKPPRAKLVRDGFTMPEADFALLATLKARAIDAKRPAKKSELLRAGLHALMPLSGAQLAAALASLAPIKTGRPKKGQ